jgi:hypothetical protein
MVIFIVHLSPDLFQNSLCEFLNGPACKQGTLTLQFNTSFYHKNETQTDFHTAHNRNVLGMGVMVCCIHKLEAAWSTASITLTSNNAEIEI